MRVLYQSLGNLFRVVVVDDPDRSVRSLGFTSNLVVLREKPSNNVTQGCLAGRQICSKTDTVSISNSEVQRSDRRTNDDNSLE